MTSKTTPSDLATGSPATADGPPPWVRPIEELALEQEIQLTQGLSSEQAAKRLAADGPNEIRSVSGPNPLILFLGQFKNFVVWVLIGAAGLAAVLGESADAIAIGAIVFLNAGIGFFQEYRAERAVAALRKLAAPLACVLRDGRSSVIPAATVVRGDVLVLTAGDLVAADARLFEAASVRSDEASLTGESQAVGKHPNPLSAAQTALGDRLNMVYLGTSIVGGQGRALVVSTGMNTEVGRIASLLDEAKDGQTPLQRRLDRVGRSLLFASLGIVALVFALGLWRGEPAGAMLLTAVSLAVAAVPEGLPAVVTVALSLGVGRMVRRHALVRRLPAVETLGSAQVICSDKTGTLTMGEMTVRVLWLTGRELEVTGRGYSPEGDLLEAGKALPETVDGALKTVLTLAVGCNQAELDERDGKSGIAGDPTEAALLVVAAKAGILRAEVEEAHPRLRVLPFDSERKRMTIVRKTADGPRAFVKGAPDLLLTRCVHLLSADGSTTAMTDEKRSEIEKANGDLAGRALRVLGVAYRNLAEAEWEPLGEEELERDLVFAGLLAMHDPPRPEALEAVKLCQRAGIRVVMITGDHPATAAAVATELGILSPGDEVVSGLQIQELKDDELSQRVEHIAVYARVTAEDKLRVVRAFKSQGSVVAMTGDGVNDAPAIKEASIGIAMGIAGTEVTKEASDMVVTDDNFASIVAAVEEGRGIYDNIKKCLQYLLAGNTAEILVMLIAVLIGWPMPLIPIQLLWINLVTDGLPALALATDPVDPDVLSRPPRPSKEEFADRGFVLLVGASGLLTASVSLLAFWYGLVIEKNLPAARNYAFSALVFSELFRSFGVRSPIRPFWHRQGPGNIRLTLVVAASVLIQLVIHHFPPLQRVFGVAPISLIECAALLALGTAPFFILEIWKGLVEKRATAAIGAAIPPAKA